MSEIKFYAYKARMAGQNMSSRNLTVFDSNFGCAVIENSFFNEVSFRNCVISCAKFRNVSFINCKLYRLDAYSTVFEHCDFTDAYMENLIFDECKFRGCDFTRCNMENVALKDCSFIDCDFEGADLPPFFKPVLMTGCKNVPYMPMACPEEGEFIGYKIASDDSVINYKIMHPYENMAPANILVTLKVPDDAKRSSAGGRKCRCDKAEIIGLEHVFTHENLPIAYSKYDGRFEYRIGEEINEPDFNENRWDECSKGIHFFINRKEALQYYNLMGVYYGGKQ